MRSTHGGCDWVRVGRRQRRNDSAAALSSEFYGMSEVDDKCLGLGWSLTALFCLGPCLEFGSHSELAPLLLPTNHLKHHELATQKDSAPQNSTRFI